MKTIKIANLSEFKGKTIVFAFFKGKYDNLTSSLKNTIGTAIEMGDFTGNQAQIITSYADSNRYFLLGLGEPEKVTTESIRRAFGKVGSKLRDSKATNVAIDLSSLSERLHLEAGIEGSLLGNYRFNALKTEEKDKKTAFEEVYFVSSSPNFDEALKYALATVEGTILVRDLGNLPSNIMTPTYLAEEASKLSSLGISIKVLEKEDIIKEKMGLFEGVFKGSAEADPPKFIIMEYKPENYAKTLVLVGKAITFDSGGISLKPGENMGDMKFDMLGGGAVIGAMRTIAMLKPANLRIIGLVPSTPNIPDAHAYRPGDILTARTGKTVEVINTDAEGRMLLADALGYAQDYKPDLVFDFATLTGAIVIGLGKINAAYYLNEQSEQLNIKDVLFKSGRTTGDYIWNMPLDEDYFEQIKSQYADIKQTGGRPAGSISAAMFLKQFTNYAWVHFDIAGTAYIDKPQYYNSSAGATGFGVRLIMDFIRNWN